MTQQEKTIIDRVLKGVNLRLLYGFAVLLITSSVGVTMAYNGIISAIRDGQHKDEMQDTRMTNIENNVSDKAWRREVDDLRKEHERDMAVLLSLKH